MGHQPGLALCQPSHHDWARSACGRWPADGHELSQQDHPAPALGLTPTTSLAANEIVHDAFRFDLAPASPPDALRLILYRPLASGGFENLIRLDLPLPTGTH
ncbi:MAG: hypothetical protein KIS63_04740 [Caldilineales bacterium]|nr:hypothetical protein [Caldilineales bacterium]